MSPTWENYLHFTSNKHSTSTHPSIHSLHHLSYWVVENLEFMPGDLRHKVGYTLHRMPVYCRVQSHTHTHSNPIKPTMHAFGLEEEAEIRGGNLQEHANSIHTERTRRCKANMLTTKPLCPQHATYSVTSTIHYSQVINH